jgi:hypothetical protein
MTEDEFKLLNPGTKRGGKLPNGHTPLVEAIV